MLQKVTQRFDMITDYSLYHHCVCMYTHTNTLSQLSVPSHWSIICRICQTDIISFMDFFKANLILCNYWAYLQVTCVREGERKIDFISDIQYMEWMARQMKPTHQLSSDSLGQETHFPSSLVQTEKVKICKTITAFYPTKGSDTHINTTRLMVTFLKQPKKSKNSQVCSKDSGGKNFHCEKQKCIFSR